MTINTNVYVNAYIHIHVYTHINEKDVDWRCLGIEAPLYPRTGGGNDIKIHTPQAAGTPFWIANKKDLE